MTGSTQLGCIKTHVADADTFASIRFHEASILEFLGMTRCKKAKRHCMLKTLIGRTRLQETDKIKMDAIKVICRRDHDGYK